MAEITGANPAITQAGDRIARREYVWFVDTSWGIGTTGLNTATWEAMGNWTEEASVSTGLTIDGMTNILGHPRTWIEAETTEITLPHSIYAGDRLGARLIEFHRGKNHAQMSSFRILEVWAMLDTAGIPVGEYHADVWTACTIMPDEIGGSGDAYIDMPITASLSGEKVQGSVDNWQGSNVTFTPTV